MRLFGASHKYRIGIDLGADSVKAVQLGGKRGSDLLSATAVMKLRKAGVFDQAEADRLAETLRRRGFKNAPVVVVAPAPMMRSAILELPPASDNVPTDQIARMEAGRIHKQLPGKFEINHWRIPVTARANRVPPALSIVVSHADSLSFVSPLLTAGFDVAAVDVWMLAAMRACSRLLAEAPVITTILDLGATAARITLTIGSTVFSVREVREAGIDRLLHSIAESLGVEVDTALGLVIQQAEAATLDPQIDQLLQAHQALLESELTASFGYAAQQYPDSSLGRMLLVGSGALLPHLPERLGSTFGQAVVVISPPRLLAASPDSFATRDSPGLTIALGAAQHPEAA